MRYASLGDIKDFVGKLVAEGSSCTALIGGKKCYVCAGDMSFDEDGCLLVKSGGNTHHIYLNGVSSINTNSIFKTVTLRFRGRESSPIKLSMTHTSIF